MRPEYQSAGDVAVGTVDTTILEATNLDGVGECVVQVKNTGAGAFTDFIVRTKSHSKGEWITLSSGTDWASTLKPWQLRVMDPDPMTLGAGLTTEVRLSIGAAYGVQVRAKRTNVTTATAKLSFGGA